MGNLARRVKRRQIRAALDKNKPGARRLALKAYLEAVTAIRRGAAAKTPVLPKRLLVTAEDIEREFKTLKGARSADHEQAD